MNIDALTRPQESVCFPQQIKSGYTILQCLSEKEHTRTYLAEDQHSGALCVIKVYERQLFESHEADILRALDHPGIPKLITQVDTDAQQFVVRSYAEGHSLEEVREVIGPDDAYAVRVMIELCGIMEYLHSQTPPVVHRDLKPSNVIVGADARVSLIDFETVRLFNPQEDTDTVTVMTPAYAPPEQFGYEQTSPPSDIYSMGVVLLYLLTGSTKVRHAGGLVRNAALSRIIGRCTAFSPQDRYRDVRALRRDLVRVQTQFRRRLRWGALTLALALAAMAVGFFVGFQQALRPAGLFGPTPVTFEEPLVESAVRLRLGMDSGTPIYPSDLETVTELYINGSRTAKAINEFWAMCTDPGSFEIEPGDIVSLQDFSRMPNLQLLYLYDQKITDLNGLSELRNLQTIDLHGNKNLVKLSGLPNQVPLDKLVLDGCSALSDLTPIAQSAIQQLSIMATGVVDLEPLRGNASIHSIWIGWNPIEDLTPLQSLPNLDYVNIMGTAVTSLEPLRGNTSIQNIDIRSTQIEDLTPLLSLPNLKVVDADTYPRSAFDALLPFSFEVQLSPDTSSGTSTGASE